MEVTANTVMTLLRLLSSFSLSDRVIAAAIARGRLTAGPDLSLMTFDLISHH